MSPDEIIVVTGIPRSGTTLMMRMLEAGGIPVYYDNDKPTEFRENGVDYINYNVILRETQKLNRLKDGDDSWLKDCKGMAVKILTPAKVRIPEGLEYKFIWMDRKLKHCAKSNKKFMLRNKIAKQHTDDFMNVLEFSDLETIMKYIQMQKEEGLKLIKTLPNSTYIMVKFEDLIKKPAWTASRVSEFLDRDFDIPKVAGLAVKRPVHCMPDMMEERIYAK